MKPAKMVPTEDDFVKSEKQGFNDEIGSITNKGTGQKSMQAAYSEDSEEYKILGYRSICCVQLQQSKIDAVKGAWSRPAPKHWTDAKAIKIEDDDSEDVIARKVRDKKLVVKKPMFFIYNYDYLYKEYSKYVKNVNANAQLRFGKTLEVLLSSEEKTEEEHEFVENYNKYLPVDCSPGVINRICWKIEDEFKNMNVLPNVDFDYHILTSGATYTKSEFKAIEEMYKEYVCTIRSIKKRYATRNDNGADDDMVSDLFLMRELWKEKCLGICNNEKVLTNILLEICYNSGNSKSMVWDICGEQIVQNLLEKNNYTFKIPTKDKNGDIDFDGNKFSILEVKVDEECDIQ
jgi:hypothetical protein